MMVYFDWTGLGIGAVAGLVMGGVFFAGLALGVLWSVGSDKALAILTLSAALRITAGMGAGWLVLTQLGPWAFAGYGAGFFLSRRMAVAVARDRTPAGGAP
jgi:hypothetical protein